MKTKCERCGRIRDLFQYTFFAEPRTITQKHYANGSDATCIVKTIEINDSRGLCEECAVEINKKKYDDNLQAK